MSVPVIAVDDPGDPRLVEYLGLRDHELRQRRERPGGDMAGVFVAEGDLVVGRALRAGYRLRSVLFDATRAQPLPDFLPPEVPVYAAGPAVLQRITGYHLHRGLIAAFDRRPPPDPAAVLAGARTVVVLENVVNPTNVGLVLRSAAGLGIDAALLDPSTCDPLYRRASRVAMGEVFAFPWSRIPALPGGLAVLDGFTVLALTPAADAEPIQHLRLPPGSRVALLLGSEGHGLRDATLAAAHRRVTIPMHRGVDSLNVGVAAAVACYAVLQAVGAPPPPTALVPSPGTAEPRRSANPWRSTSS